MFRKLLGGDSPNVHNLSINIEMPTTGQNKSVVDASSDFKSRYHLLKKSRRCSNVREIAEFAQSRVPQVSEPQQLQNMNATLNLIKNNFKDAVADDNRVMSIFRRWFPTFFEKSNKRTYDELQRTIDTITRKIKNKEAYDRRQADPQNPTPLYSLENVKRNAIGALQDVRDMQANDSTEPITALLASDNFENESKVFLEDLLNVSSQSRKSDLVTMLKKSQEFGRKIGKEPTQIDDYSHLLTAAFLAHPEDLPGFIDKMTDIFLEDPSMMEHPNAILICEVLDFCSGVHPKELVEPEMIKVDADYRQKISDNITKIKFSHRENAAKNAAKDDEEAKRIKEAKKVVELLDNIDFVADAQRLYSDFSADTLGGTATLRRDYGKRLDALIKKYTAGAIGQDDTMRILEAVALVAQDDAPNVFLKLKSLDLDIIAKPKMDLPHEGTFFSFVALVSHFENYTPS